MKKRSPVLISIALAVGLIALIIAASSVGAADIGVLDSLRILLSRIPGIGRLVDVSRISETDFTIVLLVRLPRVFLSGLVGCGLAMSGAVLQGVLRNPLADPQVLGISSGAAFGAAVAIAFGLSFSVLGIGGIAAFAFIGALLTILIVWRISFHGGKGSVVGILLAGIAVSSLLTSVITLIMVMQRDRLEMVYLWMLGSFSAASYLKVGFLFIFVAGVLLLILPSFFSLDVLATGDDSAESLGIDAQKLRRRMIILSSLAVAASVCVSGIIGFVGLIVPHIIRLLIGSRSRRLIPLSCLAGAIFMILCDTLARTLAAPAEIPVGAITAIIGAPFFLFLLWRARGKGFGG
ncbi:MAG: iron ABC transporter permease [Oscillospiraceae bacterium]|jgi:iron complex transport system permease protein|nr:iron ABC transporter permease [Oscillospiraceae bacterium]